MLITSSSISSIFTFSDLAEIFNFSLWLKIGFTKDWTSKTDGEYLFSRNALALQVVIKARLALGLGPHNIFSLTDFTSLVSGLLCLIIFKIYWTTLSPTGISFTKFCISSSSLEDNTFLGLASVSHLID